MMPLALFIGPTEAGPWVAVQPVRPGGPPGSLSDHTSGRREILLFWCDADDTRSFVAVSKGGVDFEVGPLGANRLVGTTGLRVLATLTPGGPALVRPVQPDGRKAAWVKWEHVCGQRLSAPPAGSPWCTTGGRMTISARTSRPPGSCM